MSTDTHTHIPTHTYTLGRPRAAPVTKASEQTTTTRATKHLQMCIFCLATVCPLMFYSFLTLYSPNFLFSTPPTHTHVASPFVLFSFLFFCFVNECVLLFSFQFLFHLEFHFLFFPFVACVRHLLSIPNTHTHEHRKPIALTRMPCVCQPVSLSTISIYLARCLCLCLCLSPTSFNMPNL